MRLPVLCGPSNTSLSSKGFPSHLACAASQRVASGAQCLIIGARLFEFTGLFPGWGLGWGGGSPGDG